MKKKKLATPKSYAGTITEIERHFNTSAVFRKKLKPSDDVTDFTSARLRIQMRSKNGRIYWWFTPQQNVRLKTLKGKANKWHSADLVSKLKPNDRVVVSGRLCGENEYGTQLNYVYLTLQQPPTTRIELQKNIRALQLELDAFNLANPES